MPSCPRSWANCSLLYLYSHRNARAKLHLLGQPNTLRVQGFEASGEADGHCGISGAETHANYTGQAVSCAPERDLNGQLSEGYCTMAAGEAVLDCCELAGGENRARSHCRFVRPRIRFIPYSLRYSVPLFLKRQCDRTLGSQDALPHHGRADQGGGHDGGGRVPGRHVGQARLRHLRKDLRPPDRHDQRHHPGPCSVPTRTSRSDAQSPPPRP